MSDSDRITVVERGLRILGALTSKTARFWLLIAVAALVGGGWGLISYGSARIDALTAKNDKLELDFREHLLKREPLLVAALERNTAAFEHSAAAWERLRIILDRLPLFKNP
jgi:hypothetical protein